MMLAVTEKDAPSGCCMVFANAASIDIDIVANMAAALHGHLLKCAKYLLRFRSIKIAD